MHTRPNDTDKTLAEVARKLADIQKNYNNPSPVIPLIDELDLKIIAFKRIYWALRSGQDNHHVFKTNFLADKNEFNSLEMERDILKHVKKKSHGRTAKAWKLANEHFLSCESQNDKLFLEIYQEAF